MGRKGKTKRDWVQAGQTLLIDGGIDAVKLHSLTARLGVSTGSFYHHFGNFEEYLATLADFYGSEQAQLPFDEARARVGDDPRALLTEATAIFGAGAGRQLNVAMRAWAQMDDRANAAVRRYDEALSSNLDEMFLALGYEDLAAKARTLILMGLAKVDIDPDLMNPGFGDRWVYIRDELMLPK